MKARVEETTCLLDLAGKCSVMASVQVPVQGMVRERKAACWMEKRAFSMQKQEVIPGGWKSQREVIITQYDTDPVEHAMEKKGMIPAGWNSQRESNNTQYDFGPFEGTMKEREMIPGWME